MDTDRPSAGVPAVPLEPESLNGYCVSGEPDHQFFVSADRDVLVMEWAGVWVGSPSHKVADLVAEGVKIQVLQ